MRVRLIRPSYWTDADLHARLSADVREFYIGLWMTADDAGFVAWDVDRLGAELYPYRTAAWRRAKLPAWLVALGDHHARLLPCGRHVVIPNLPKYQQPPRPSRQNERAHDACRWQQVVADGTTDEQVAPAQSKGVVKEGKGVVKGGPAAETDFATKMAANGYREG
jgi:hypothetical protein